MACFGKPKWKRNGQGGDLKLEEGCFFLNAEGEEGVEGKTGI
jgi:hypothetical protein